MSSDSSSGGGCSLTRRRYKALHLGNLIFGARCGDRLMSRRAMVYAGPSGSGEPLFIVRECDTLQPGTQYPGTYLGANASFVPVFEVSCCDCNPPPPPPPSESSSSSSSSPSQSSSSSPSSSSSSSSSPPSESSSSPSSSSPPPSESSRSKPSSSSSSLSSSSASSQGSDTTSVCGTCTFTWNGSGWGAGPISDNCTAPFPGGPKCACNPPQFNGSFPNQVVTTDCGAI